MSQARLASIMSTSAWVMLTFEPSRLRGDEPRLRIGRQRAAVLDPEQAVEALERSREPAGETSFSRSTCCGWLGSPPGGTIQIVPSSVDADRIGRREVIGPCSPSTGRPSPVVSTPGRAI